MQIEKLSFPLERRPRLRLGPSKWVCMEVFNINNDRGVISIPRLKPRALITPGSLLIHYIMAYEYSNIILFYCFANKLIAVTKKINDMMSNDNPYQTIPLSNAFLNYLRK